MPAARIDGITAVGTTEGDELAYVQCVLQDGSVHALAFAAEMAGPLCSAFLTATGHLQRKQAMRGVATDSIVVDLSTASVTKSTDGSVILELATKSGATLRFHVSSEALTVPDLTTRAVN